MAPKPCSVLSERNFNKIIFLDLDSSGFTYGHVYPFSFIKELFGTDSLPRCFPIPESITETNTPSSPDLNTFVNSNESILFQLILVNLEHTPPSPPQRPDPQTIISTDFSPLDFGFNFIQASDFLYYSLAC